MEKIIAEHVNTFEHRVKLALENFVKEVLNEKNYDEVHHFAIGVDKTTLELYTSESSDFTDNVVKLFNCATCKRLFVDGDVNNAKLYETLTKEEKSAYLLRQQFYLSNGDFMFFNVDNLLSDYCMSMFKTSFDKYVKLRASEYVARLMNTNEFKDVRKKFINLVKIAKTADETLNRVKEELSDLETRAKKLSDFISQKRHLNLNKAQQNLLPLQLDYMDNLIQVLKSRIEHWFDEDKEGDNEQ